MAITTYAELQTARSAQCHSERTHYARGLCRQCYNLQRYHAKPEVFRARSRDYQQRNREGRKEYMRGWKQRNPDWHADNHRKRLYGIEPEQYAALLAAQDGRCAICDEQPSKSRHLHVDHDHDSGVVRALLCHGCNTGLGSLRSPTLLRKAADYLEAHRGD